MTEHVSSQALLAKSLEILRTRPGEPLDTVDTQAGRKVVMGSFTFVRENGVACPHDARLVSRLTITVRELEGREVRGVIWYGVGWKGDHDPPILEEVALPPKRRKDVMRLVCIPSDDPGAEEQL
jgi:hypothetical protein